LQQSPTNLATVPDSPGLPFRYIFWRRRWKVIPKSKLEAPFDVKVFLTKTNGERTITSYPNNARSFGQGDPVDAIYYIQKGKVKLTVVSKSGKEAVVALLGEGDFFGEGCLAGQPLRMATVVTLSSCSIMRLEKAGVIRLLHEEPLFSEMFVTHLLSRNIKIEEDLVDQLFNSSEKRLARVLLLLANFGKEGKPEEVIAKMSQETLAEIVGTTRSRVSFFMNRFRKLGFIEYNGKLKIHSSLLNVILHD
jgi:CRP/FNR family transcriptional regulator, cyclic AMP receptor protein